jgi:hypothetical protein
MQADKKWGVIPIKYRQVPCDYIQNKPVSPISSPTAPERSPPSGWSSSMDKVRGCQPALLGTAAMVAAS